MTSDGREISGILRGRARRIGLAALLALTALGLSGCITSKLLAPVPFSERAENVFAAGYTHLATRYIEPLRVEEVAIEGMRGVGAIDESLAVERRGKRLRLVSNGRTVQEFLTPPDDDPDSWAALTVAVVEAGKRTSPLLQQASAEEIYEVVFDGALAGLDPFTRYASAEDARDQRAARQGFGGIGVVIRVEDEGVYVVSVIPDGPAARKGIQADDRILRVDGTELRSTKLRDAIDYLRGPVDSTVVVTVDRPGLPKPFDVAIRRQLIVPPTVEFEAVGDIAVLRMSGFNQDTAESLAEAVHKAQQQLGRRLKGYILDLRANPGGLLDQAVSVSDEFLQRGQIVFTRGRHPDSYQTFSATYGDITKGKPMVVLINNSTASAAEIVAAALQDQRRAVVVGTTSYGKGTVQTVHRLPNDGELIITWSRFHAPSGYPLNHLGVLPNVCTSVVRGRPVERAAQVIEALRSDGFENSDLWRAWHAAVKMPESRIETLREACPPRKGEEDIELEVARRILDDRALYARALKLSAAQVAER